MSKQYLEAKRWLKSMSDAYPWRAVAAPYEKAPAGIDDSEETAAISRLTAFSCRTWAFKSEEVRDRFVAQVETAESAGCEAP